MSPRRKRIKQMFWAAIAAVLLFGAGRIVADPTRFGPSERTPVIISEFLAAQPPVDPANAENAPVSAGWVELYNRSGQTINLANWSLTDDPTDPEKWLLPQLEIESGQTILIWTKNALVPETMEEPLEEPLVANVELFPMGGFLALYPPTVTRFSNAVSITYPAQMPEISYGRVDPRKRDGQYSYLASVTPGEMNDGGVIWQGMTSRVIASVERGFFDAPFEVTLRTERFEDEIRYTLDGSTPTADNGTVYTNAIQIERTMLLRAVAFTNGYLPNAATTHSYIFPKDVAQQPADPNGVSNSTWPKNWGTHRITFLGYDEGAPVIPDYEMDPNITQHPDYGKQMVDSLLAIPSVSIVTDMSNLDIYFDDPQMRGPQAERPASVEFLYPNEPHRNVQSGTGLRVQGGAGRWEFMPKHSFRLFFKQRYGATRLQHKVFDDTHLETFNTLTLRAGVDRSFAGHPDSADGINDHRLTTYTRDEFARDTQIAMSGFGSHGIFVHLYLNGLYWGLYNMVERPDRIFAADYFGGDVEDWFTATHGGAGDGQIDRFTVMLQLAQARGLADPAKYATMLEFVDPIQFSDYMILNWFIGNRDWPENNWYVNVRYPAGRNLFFVWDAEYSWNDGPELRLGPDGNEGAPFPSVAKIVFLALIENEEYRRILGDRLAKHLHPDGVLGDAQVQARWRSIADPLTTAIIAESARWGDTRYADPITQEDWIVANQAVLDQMDGAAESLLQQARDAGYYPQVDAPTFRRVGDYSMELVATDADSGEIYYTLDGSDPMGEGAQIYVEPLPFTSAVTVKARLRQNDTWSALAEMAYRREDQLPDVRITEIMYNPQNGSEFGEAARPADFYEFIEIRNVGKFEADLSLAFFDGIDFVFPNYTTLAAGATMVLIRDFHAFRQRYPTADFHGIYGGKLSNRGETIALRDVHGTIVASVSYDDENGWPVSADGTGDSLVLQRLDGAADNPQSWGVSSNVYGSPGE